VLVPQVAMAISDSGNHRRCEFPDRRSFQFETRRRSRPGDGHTCSSTIRCGATVSSPPSGQHHDQAVTWQVGDNGRQSHGGTIRHASTRRPPICRVPRVTVTPSPCRPRPKASVTVNLQNALPLVTSVTSQHGEPRQCDLTVNGNRVCEGATIYLPRRAAPTAFVSTPRHHSHGHVAIPVGVWQRSRSPIEPARPTSAPSAVPSRGE